MTGPSNDSVIDTTQSRAYRTRGGDDVLIVHHPEKEGTYFGIIHERRCTWDQSGRALHVQGQEPIDHPSSWDIVEMLSTVEARDLNSTIGRDQAAASAQRAPRVTLEQIHSLVQKERFVVDDTFVICILTLKNGWKVTGESRPADPQNFDEALGRKIARDKAVGNVWPLAGYLLRDSLHRGEHPPVVRCKMTCTGHMPMVVPENGATWDPVSMCYDRSRADGVVVSLHAVYENGADGNAVEENRIFGKASPHAHLSMHLRNPEAIRALRPGANFYVDFTPA